MRPDRKRRPMRLRGRFVGNLGVGGSRARMTTCLLAHPQRDVEADYLGQLCAQVVCANGCVIGSAVTSIEVRFWPTPIAMSSPRRCTAKRAF